MTDFGPQLLGKVLGANEEVLAQLGLRIQHALRAFTPSDAKKLRATVSTYPRSELYDAPKETGAGAIGDFLRSRKGKAMQRKVTRGVFRMLRKRL